MTQRIIFKKRCDVARVNNNDGSILTAVPEYHLCIFFEPQRCKDAKKKMKGRKLMVLIFTTLQYPSRSS